MADTAVATLNYDSIINRQHKRILELEADLARYTDKIRHLKTRATENHQAAFAAAAAAHVNANDYARVHAAHMQAMLAMSTQPPIPLPPTHPHFAAAAAAAAAAHMPMLPTSPTPTAPLTTAPPHNIFAAQAHAAAVARPHAPQEEDDRAGKTRYWTEMEHNQFLYAAKLFGPKNYVAISQFVGTRNAKQVRTHAQKYQMKLEREAKKRRAQAAAVAAATAPGAAAAAAAAAGMYHDPRIPMPGMPMPIPVPIPGMGKDVIAKSVAKSTSKDLNNNSESENAQSESTCPLLNDSSDLKKMEALRESACSPVSNESEGDTEMESVNEKNLDAAMDDVDLPPSNGAAVPHFPGLRKNNSTGNFSDYDDFMSRITSAVHHRNDSTEMFDDSTNEIDVDILGTSSKTEPFEDSLLAEI